MAFEEVAVICFSFVTCIGVLALAYFKSEERKEQIRQTGITNRATMKLGMPGENNATSMPTGEWWVPLATELLKNPAIQDMIMKKVAPTLTGVKTES
jgi:hypothetical protein